MQSGRNYRQRRRNNTNAAAQTAQSERKAALNWKKHLYRGILWVITLGILLMMFGFSSQDSTQSGSISGQIARPITDFLAQRQGLTGQAYWNLYAQVDFAVRKTAHFSEYALLGVLLTLLLDSYGVRWRWLSWAGCTLYAATDEIHQLFVDGRTGKWQDVLIDSSGAMTGMLLAFLALWLIRRRSTKKT